MSLSTALAGVGVLVIVATGASTALDVARARQAVIEHRLTELSNLARALCEQTRRSIQAAEVVVRETAADELFATPRRAHDRRALPLVLRRRIAAVPQVRALEILDASGNVAYSSAALPAARRPQADRPFFADARADPASGTGISKAYRDGADDEWTLALSRRIDGAGGRFLGVAVATLDLRYFERFYRAIGLPAGSFIALYQSDGVLLARDPRVEAAIGRSFASLPLFADLQETVTTSSTRFQDPLDGEPKLFAAQRVAGLPLVVGVGLSEEVALAPWRQQALHTALRALPLSASVALLIGLVMRQLKQRERADARLRESEERYALAMAGSNEGHWDWDLRARQVYLSSRMLALAGRDGGDLVTGDDWLERLDLVHPEDRTRRQLALTDHLKGRTAHYECEYRVRDGSGHYRWLHDRGLGLRDAHRRVYRMAGAVSDITERKLAESERQRLEQRLRQAEKLEALGTMAGGIAHDFNNILGSILGYGDMAVHAAAEGSALKRYTTNVMTAANRAKNLVDQILTYSRTGRGRRETVDLRALLEETAELLRASAPEGVRVEVHLDTADAAVVADPTQLHQLIMNLCTNGIQAMRSGGRLALGLEAIDTATERALSHGVLTAGRYLRLWVRDTGCGIPAAVLPRIFEPFFTTKDPGAGTGLGLALVHGIVADLGGTLHVLSSVGEGSTFEVYLPRPQSRSGAAARQAGAPGQGQRIILLDHERARLLLGEEMLAALGYDPAGFFDPHSALEALTSDLTGFDALVARQPLPGMTVTQLATRVRQLNKRIPIVLVGSHHDAALEQEARTAGIDRFLSQPLDQDSLAQAVAQALAAAQQCGP